MGTRTGGTKRDCGHSVHGVYLVVKGVSSGKRRMGDCNERRDISHKTLGPRRR